MSADSSGSSHSTSVMLQNNVVLSSAVPSVEPVHAEHGKKTVMVAFLANILIAAIKAVAGVFTGHSALLAEAIHSFADAMNSCFLMIGLQKGSRLPDKTHPFGYGLETTLWATLASIAMLALAGWSISIGLHRLVTPVVFGSYYLSAGILLASLVLETLAIRVACHAIFSELDMVAPRGFFSFYFKAFKLVNKTASPTTRFVFFEDSVAFVGTIVALVAITLSEFGAQLELIPAGVVHVPDAAASVFIGLLILLLAGYLFVSNSRGLTGAAASPEQEQRIRDLVLSIHGVSKIHDLRTSDFGLSGVVVTLRIEVSPDIQVKDVDDLTEHVRERLQSRIKGIKEVIIEVQADETHEVWGDAFDRLVDNGQQQGVLKESETRILKNIFDFTQSVASDVMIPRTAADCIAVNEPIDALINLFEECGESKVLVYGEDLDNILGVVELLDLVPHLKPSNAEQLQQLTIQQLIQPVQVYPETKPVSDLLEEFKRKKIEIAMVADEHGGFAGIVTLEDLLEEIVGEVWEEDDDEELVLEQPAPNRIICSGRYPIDELNEAFGWHIPDEEYNTIGGFVFGLLGEAPQIGAEVQFEELTMRVVAVDHLRIDKVEVESPVPLTPAEEEMITSTAVHSPENALDTPEAAATASVTASLGNFHFLI